MTDNQQKNIAICPDQIRMLMPMHIIVDAQGIITQMGRTIEKIAKASEWKSDSIFDCLQFQRPLVAKNMCDLQSAKGKPLTVHLKEDETVSMKGTLVSLAEGNLLLNLSLGFSMISVVQRFGLTLNDFAHTDATVEMLYLVEAKTHAWKLSKDLSERLEVSRQVAEKQAFTDMLTGLKNRRALDQTLDGLTNDKSKEMFGLMHVDLDYFKQVNDTQGHAAGDAVLQRVAEVLKKETHKDDLVARVGGDEFVLLIRNCNDLVLLDAIAQRVITGLEVPIPFEGQNCRISASIGTTISKYYTPLDSDRMLSDADLALYASKDKGRAQHTMFSPENQDWLPKPGAEIAPPAR